MLTDSLLLFAGYCSFLAFALSPVIFCALHFKYRPEKGFLPLLILNSLIFYLFAVFHVSHIGFPILYAGNIALGAASLFKFFKLAPKERHERLFTPGFYMLLFGVTMVFLFLCNHRFSTWDSVSHWGRAVKFFMTDNKLPCEYPGAVLAHASYPPGTCMTSALIHSCFFGLPFRDGIVIFSHEIISFSALLWIFSSVNWQHKKLFFVCAGAPFIMSLLFIFGSYILCYTDLSLTMLMAVALYQILTFKRYGKTEMFMSALLLSWLFMIRNAGWGYCIGLLLLLTIQGFLDRKKLFYDPDTHHFPVGRLSMFLLNYLLPLAVKLSWVIQLKYYNTDLRFGGKNISWDGLVEKFGTFDGVGWHVLGKFIETASIPLLIFGWFLVPVVIMIRRYGNQNQRRAALTGTIFFFISLVMFLSTMFTFYLFEFNERSLFPSFYRYFNNFLFIYCACFTFLLIEMLAEKTYFQSPLKSKFWNSRVTLILFCTVSVFLLLFTIKKVTRIGEITYVRWMDSCAKTKKYDHLLNREGVTFALISYYGNGFQNLSASFYYPHQFKGMDCWYPVSAGEGRQPRWFSTTMRPQELMKELKNHDYIFIDRVDEEFIRDFGEVFVDGQVMDPEKINGRLFKVTGNNRLAAVD